MTYDPKKLQEKVLPNEGDRVEATVTEIHEGKLGDLVDGEVLSEWKNADPDSKAIEVVARGDEGAMARRILQVPHDGFVNPRSNMGKWKTIYGEYPHMNQRVTLMADKKGYFRFLL